jgi:hypothetical protein
MAIPPATNSEIDCQDRRAELLSQLYDHKNDHGNSEQFVDPIAWRVAKHSRFPMLQWERELIGQLVVEVQHRGENGSTD